MLAARSSIGVLSAFVFGAAGVAVIAWGSSSSERDRVEREFTGRLEARAGEAAARVAIVIEDALESVLDDSGAVVVRDGAFVRPRVARPLRRLGDSRGLDPIGDALLAQADLLAADPARHDELETLLRKLARVDGLRDPSVAFAARARLVALLARRGRDEEALLERKAFVADLRGEASISAEGLLFRIEQGERGEELRDDILLALATGDDELVFGMLRRAGIADSAAIDARRADLAAIELARPLFGMLAENGNGAACIGPDSIAVWREAEDGGRHLSFFEAGLAGSGAQLSERGAAPVEGSPGDLVATADVVPWLPGIQVRGASPAAEVDAEVRRRLRLTWGALAALLAGGSILLYFTLRAVRRESTAARAHSDFVARVSHDLRTPLAIVRMYAETIAQGRATRPEQVREFATIAQREAERLSDLVARVLDFSRASRRDPRGTTSPIDVGALLAEVADERSPALEKAGMRLESSVHGGPLLVAGDRDGLRAAIANLIDNAIGHAISGGSVDVRVDGTSDSVRIRVGDRGPGLPPGLGRRIFDPFVRGPAPLSGGTGLGLALVNEVAAAHRGRVDASDRDGGGAEFTLTLPRAADSGAQARIEAGGR